MREVEEGERHVAKSVQDELTEFFAATVPATSSLKPSVPVKGTIQSLFSNAAASNEKKKRLREKHAAGNTMLVRHQQQQIDLTSPAKTPLDRKSTRRTEKFTAAKRRLVHCQEHIDLTSPVKTPLDRGSQLEYQLVEETVKWTCSRCTLENTARKGGNTVCKACGESWVMDGSSPTSSTITTGAEPKFDTGCETARKNKDVIVLEDTEILSLDMSNASKKRKRESSFLEFAISFNTGRINVFVDSEATERPFVNFDANDILKASYVDTLMDIKYDRARTQRPTIEFDEGLLTELVGKVTTCDQKDRRAKAPAYRSEIMSFVSKLCVIGEKGKKLLSSSGQRVCHQTVQEVALGLLQSSGSHQTSRYSGGAKERARENQAEGKETEIDTLVLSGKACAWCANKLSSASYHGNSAYCSESCAIEGRLRRGGMYASARIRSTVFAIESGVCTICGVDAHSLFRQICALEPAERLNRLLSAKWRLPTTRKAMDSLLNDPKEGNRINSS